MIHLNYRKKILLSFFFLSTFFSSISSKDLEEENWEILKLSLSKNSSYKFFYGDILEGKTPWKFYQSTSYVTDTKFVPKIPESKIFGEETEFFSGILKIDPPRSLQVHAYLEIPDREKLRIRPEEKKILPYSIPIRVFLWLHSSNYAGQAKLVLSHPKKKDTIVVIGDLGYHGWKRLEAVIPIPTGEIKLNNPSKDRFSIKEIVFEFTKNQKRTHVTLFLSRLGFLLDRNTPLYPGIEIEDGWYITK
ncbi:MAG: hypothetical protein SFU98_22495 [Leptospiraceae bacterium]|nr:hypothetical protein [Leptospiraceae bacterium]